LYRTAVELGGSSTVTIYGGYGDILPLALNFFEVNGLHFTLMLMDEATNTWVGSYLAREESKMVYGTARLSLGPGNVMSQIQLRTGYTFRTIQANVLTD
jgi:hypothetical protein